MVEDPLKNVLDKTIDVVQDISGAVIEMKTDIKHVENAIQEKVETIADVADRVAENISSETEQENVI
jgi:uncharacterized protein YoxC